MILLICVYCPVFGKSFFVVCLVCYVSLSAGGWQGVYIGTLTLFFFVGVRSVLPFYFFFNCVGLVRNDFNFFYLFYYFRRFSLITICTVDD